MNIHEEIELLDCPFCGGVGTLEEENGWCWYVVCADCGAQTASMEFRTEAERLSAAHKVSELWNMGKALRGGYTD